MDTTQPKRFTQPETADRC